MRVHLAAHIEMAGAVKSHVPEVRVVLHASPEYIAERLVQTTARQRDRFCAALRANMGGEVQDFAGTKGQEPGFVHTVLSFFGLKIFRQANYGCGWLELVSDNEFQGQVSDFSVIVERNNTLRVADQIKFEPGPADDVVEVLFVHFRQIGDAEPQLVEQVLSGKDRRPVRFR
ncbi:MAG TPA: hypothetical protein VF313_10430 [Anaerolineaceae bacterium]